VNPVFAGFALFVPRDWYSSSPVQIRI